MLELIELLEGMDGAWGQMQEGLQMLIGIYCIVGGILAVVQCFFGYKLLKLWITLIGGVFGGGLGFAIGLAQGSQEAALLCFIIGALIGGFIAFKIYLVGVFFIGVLGGLLVGIALGAMLGAGTATVGLALILGIVGGIGVLILQRPAIIITTSLGAGMQLMGIFSLVFGSSLAGGLLGAIIMCIGMWYQFTGGKVKKIATAQEMKPEAVKVSGIQQVVETTGQEASVAQQVVETTGQETSVAQQVIEATGQEASATQQQAGVGQPSSKGIDVQHIQETLQEGVKQLSVVGAQGLTFAKEGSKKFLDYMETLELKDKFEKAKEVTKTYYKKAMTYLAQPHIKKRCIFIGSAVVGVLLVGIIGRFIYIDSLNYKIPEESKLQEMAIQALEQETGTFQSLILEDLTKKNRKTYELSLQGSYIEGSVDVLGHYTSTYTYENERWEMSVPILESTERLGIMYELSQDIVYDRLWNELEAKLVEDADGTMYIVGQDIQINTDWDNYKALCEFDLEMTKGVQTYQASGTVAYIIGEDNEWQEAEGSLAYELTNEGISQTPNKILIKQILQDYGVELETTKEVIYFNQKDLTIQSAEFLQIDEVWYAACEVNVSNPYRSGSFSVNIPYYVEGDYLVEEVYDSLEVTTSQLSPLEEKIKPVNKEELLSFWQDERTLYLKDENEKSISYSLSEDLSIAIGSRVLLDLRSEDDKVIVAYEAKFKDKESEVEFWVNIPYKHVLDELVVQYRLATYTHANVTIYPVTVERIKEDLQNRYLDMEAQTQKVNRYTGEGVVDLQIKETIEEDYETHYIVAAKFQIEEEGTTKEYLGEYKVRYRKGDKGYTLSNISFID